MKRGKMTDESWRDYNVAQRNLHMLNTESMADCTFLVGIEKEKKFQCHKSILCHGSAVFYAMFNGELQEKGEVKVEDIAPQPFRKMLEYIYSDNTELENAETALGVCYAANKYMINKLIPKCINFIKENLDADIVCRALEFSRVIDNVDLEAESLHYIQTNTHCVLKSESFSSAEKETLLTILEQDHLWIPYEVEVFSACIRWAEAHDKCGDNANLRDVLGPEVLKLIRFLTMTAQEFATVVVRSQLLEVHEERDILCRIVTGTGNIPKGFNITTEIRKAQQGQKKKVLKNYNVILCKRMH